MNAQYRQQLAAMATTRAALVAQMERCAAQVVLEYFTDRGLPHLDTDLHRAIPEGIDVDDSAYEPMCDALPNLNAKLFDWVGDGAYYRVTREALQAHLAQHRNPPVPETAQSLNIASVTPRRNRLHIDDSALHKWMMNSGEEGQNQNHYLPSSSSQYLAKDLARMIKSACKSGALVVSSLDLEVVSSDCHDRPSGFYVMLRNQPGDHRQILLTSGYTELEVPSRHNESAQSASERARRYLELVCGVANTLLDSI